MRGKKRPNNPGKNLWHNVEQKEDNKYDVEFGTQDISAESEPSSQRQPYFQMHHMEVSERKNIPKGHISIY